MYGEGAGQERRRVTHARMAGAWAPDGLRFAGLAVAQKDAGKASETDFLQAIGMIAGKSMVHHELGMHALLTVN